MQDGAKVFGIEGPSVDFEVVVHARNVPSLDESVETFDERGFVELLGEFLEHIDVSVLIHDFFGNVSAQNKPGVGFVFMISDGVFAGFEIPFEGGAHFVGVSKRNGLYFVEDDEVVVGDDAVFALILIVKHLCTRHGAAAGEPSKTADASVEIRFSRSFGGQFDEIQAFFEEWKDAREHGDLLVFVAITVGIVIDGGQKDVDPFFGCELFSRIFVEVDIDVIRAEMLEVEEFNFPAFGAFHFAGGREPGVVIFGIAVSQRHNAPRVPSRREVLRALGPDAFVDDGVRRGKSVIGERKRNVARFDVDIGGNSGQKLDVFAFDDEAVFDGCPFLAFGEIPVDKVDQSLLVEFAGVSILEFVQQPVPHKGRQGKRGKEVCMFQVFIDDHVGEMVFEFFGEDKIHERSPCLVQIKIVVDACGPSARFEWNVFEECRVHVDFDGV